MAIPADELPVIAGHCTYWRQDVLDNDEMDRRGKMLKAKIGEQLKHNCLFPKKTTSHIDQYRLPPEQDKTFGTRPEDGMNGMFYIRYKDTNIVFRCLVSNGDGETPRVPWEHVSACARAKNSKGRNYERVPNWEEMCWIKDLFWGEEETVVQFHPAKENYVNCHPNVLHLWKWTGGEFPIPEKHRV